MSLVFRTLLVMSVVLVAACDNAGTSTELTRPDTPPASLRSFNGTLQPGATDTYVFAVAQSGYVEATLVALNAAAGTQVQLALGTPGNNGACQTTFSVVATAGPNAQMVGTGLAGNLCITITDIGQLTSPALYTITVAAS